MTQPVNSTLASSLRARFTALALSLGALTEQAETWGTTFAKRYTEPQRHYHTVAHVAAMLECLEGYKTKITDPVAVELAVFFHDWVYEPQGKANEAESAVVFAHFAAELGIEEELKQKIIVMIDATVGHGVGEDIPVRQRDDLELFLDFDLEVLGRDWEDYMAYAKKIRMEYICFEEQDYNMGRAKVLRTFLDRKRVYFSESFYTKKEETARQNMQREIELLESGGV